MATDHNFRIKNGLTVGAVEVIDSSGKLTANAFGTNSNEKIEDVVADMITGSTHSNITVTYNDTNGTLAFSAAAQYGDSDVESYLDGGTSTPSFATISSGAINATGDITITSTYPKLSFVDTDNNPDISIIGGSGQIAFYDETNSGYVYQYISGQHNFASKNLTNIGTISSGAITSSGAIDGTKISVDSGGSLGLRLHSNSGITASNNYMNFFTSQTSGWSFNTNGTGADSGSVFTISSTGAISGTSLDTGQGANELYAMNQNVRTTDAVTFTTVNTGQGATEVHLMNQNVRTTDAVTFTTVNTGQGANELYAMNQNVRTTDSPTFNQVTTTNNGSGTNYKVGDDAWIGDINVANTIRISGVQNANNGYISFGNSSNTALGRAGTGQLTWGSDEIYHEGHKPTYSELGTMAYSNLTGTPTIPSLSGYATESYVGTQISNLVDSSPASLNTLNELAAALGDDANFSTTITNSIATKMPKAGGTFTGSLIQGYAAGTNEMFKWQNTTSGGHIQLGFQQNDTDGLHHRLYIKAYKGSASASGNVDLIVRGSGGSLTSDVLELHAGQRASWQGNDIFTDAYHPNADKWTTARSHTVTLTGEVTGTATQSVDGTGNKTWSIATALGNTALDDQYAIKHTFNPGSSGGSRRYVKLFTLDDFDDSVVGILSSAGDYGDADRASYQIQIATRTGISMDVFQLGVGGVSDDYQFYHKQDASSNYEIWALMADYNQPNTFTTLSEYGSVTYNFDSVTTTAPTGLTQITKQKIFHDAYHPNADTLTTARTIAGTSFNGSADIDINYNNLTNKPTIPSSSSFVTLTGAQSISGIKTHTSRLALSAGQMLSLGDTNHHLVKVTTGYSGVTVDGPRLQGHQGGELATNINSNQYALRWDASGSITVRNNINVLNDIVVGTYSTTNTGTLYLTGSTANKQATLKCTNGNLHMDGASGNSMYLNYYTGTSVHFGTGAGGVGAVMGPDGDLWKGSSDNSGSKYWHAGNDGASSGLDADLLDGQHGSYYLNYNNLSNTPTIPAAVTNNNQLTNGAGYITSYSETDTLATVVSRGASTSNTVTMTGGIVGNSFRVRRQDNNGTIWFNGSSATDTNHALWNAYYGNSPTTRGSAGSGLDGIYWNTYRGIHIRGGLAGAVDCIKVQNSSGSNTDHTVTLYASNVARLATNTSGVDVTGRTTTDGLTSAGSIIVSGASPTIVSRGSDSEVVFQSTNESAGNPQQFYIQHNLGNVNIGNSRGNINFNAGTLQYGGNTVLTTASTQSKYLRSDTSDSHTSGQITFNGGIHIGSTNTYIVQHVTNGLGFRVGTGNFYGLKIDPTAGHTETIKTGVGGAFNALQGVLQVKGDQTMNRGSIIRWANDGGGTGEYIHSKAASPYDVCLHSGSYDGIQVPNTGSVRINYNGAQKFVTTSAGVSITGSLTASGNVTAYSDRNKKKNIRDLESASKYLNAINPKRFAWKDTEKEDIGFIAQDVEEAGLSEFVCDSPEYNTETALEEGIVKTLDYGKMVSVLWGAVKEQQEQIEELKSIINTLVESK